MSLAEISFEMRVMVEARSFGCYGIYRINPIETSTLVYNRYLLKNKTELSTENNNLKDTFLAILGKLNTKELILYHYVIIINFFCTLNF